MNYVAVAAVTMMISFVWFAQMEGEVRKDYAKAGYIVIDKTAYRLTPANPYSP